MRRSAKRALQVVALALVYAVVGRLGLALGAVNSFATLVWPPTGIALAALVRLGPAAWPGVALGAFAVNLWKGAPADVAAAIAVGNTLEAVLGAWALRRAGAARGDLAELRVACALVVPAALVSTALSATVGVASLRVGHLLAAGAVGETWRAWWVGDVLGDLVVGAALLAWTRRRRFDLRPARLVEAAALAVAVAASVAVVFVVRVPVDSPFVRSYVVFPSLIWAALRFGARGATIATFIVAALAVAGTAAGHGPYVRATLSAGLFELQAFMATVAATTLFLAAAAAERAAAVHRRDEVLARVSHDLVNPLSVVEMSARTLRQRHADDDVTCTKVGRIAHAAERMQVLVRDLLDQSALDAGRLSLRLDTHDAGALAREAVDMLRPLAEERGLRLRTPTGETPIVVRCDRERTLQVLTNLLANAVKHSPDDADITVEVAPRDGGACYAVGDHGPGMTTDEQRRAFDRFWQAAPTARHGSGLGLSIARGLVEAHGGRIWIDSTVGKGTTVRFTLPAAR